MKGKLRSSWSARLSQTVVLAIAITMLLTSATGYSQSLTTTSMHPASMVLSQPRHLGVSRLMPSAVSYAKLPLHKATRLLPASQDVISLPHTDCTSRPCLVLSFDDGPDPITTPQILSILEQKHIAASFFLVGKNIAGNQTLVQRMVADGFEVGNHSWSHGDMTKMTPEQINQELISTQQAIVAAGAPAPTLFRPPYGAINEQLVNQAGLQTALWNIDPEDWHATDPAALAQTMIASAKPGGIMDLHDIHQITVDVLPSVIDRLTAEGYQFETVSQLLHSRDRPGRDPFYGYAQPTPPM